jgi:arsenate reductase (thioredoxin)
MNTSLGRPYHVLFLCTGNSARSILAESLLNHWGKGGFVGLSAGSFPKGQVHPVALALLQQMKFPVNGLRSKSWNEFSGAGAPPLDFIFTVCGNAASEVCPIWPGQPVTAHWGVPDPAAVEGPEAEQWAAFRQAFTSLEQRVKAFLSLPLESLDRMRLEASVREIGRTE